VGLEFLKAKSRCSLVGRNQNFRTSYLHLQGRKWRQQVLPKSWYLSTKLHVTFQKKVFFKILCPCLISKIMFMPHLLKFITLIIILIQFFVIYVPSQQPQGQLQTQHSVDTSNYMWTNTT
jgi:hypothetical protein